MKNSKSAGQEESAGIEPELFAFDSQALTELAAGSSVFIASVLAITDVIPLIPNATSATGLLLRVVGDWIIAAVIWFLGFLAITQLLRFVSRGVWLSEKGIKLSRFDRVVPWRSIRAVAVEPNVFFSRIFSLKQTARRLTILFHFEIKNKLLSQLLFPNYIPSFFFSKETFDRLIEAVFERSGALQKSALPIPLENHYAVLATTGDEWKRIKFTYIWLDKQKILVSTIILFSLLIFLGRKAMVYYCFNSAGKAAAQARYESARDYYRWSVKLEPTFAPGWNGLGQAEFRLAEQRQSDFDVAVRDWQRAILLKLDFVEPRLNIVRVYFYQRKFNEARDLLDHALKLAPYDGLALLEKAELDFYCGDLRQAQKEARLLLSEGIASTQNPEYIFKARCLLAQVKLRSGDLAGAQAELQKIHADARLSQSGDLTYMLTTKAQIFVASHDLVQADQTIRLALRRQPFNEEVLLEAASISLALLKYDEAEFFLQRMKSLNQTCYKLPVETISAALSEGRNRYDGALSHYETAVALAAVADRFDSQYTSDLKQRLGSLSNSTLLNQSQKQKAQELFARLAVRNYVK